MSDPASEWSGVDQERAFDLVEVLEEIGSSRGATVAQVALAWQLARPWLTSIVLGARTVDQLEDNLGATKVNLAREEVERIEAIVPAPRRWPAWHIEAEAKRRDLAD